MEQLTVDGKQPLGSTNCSRRVIEIKQHILIRLLRTMEATASFFRKSKNRGKPAQGCPTSVNTTYDSDFCGLADEGGRTVTCKHGVVVARFVAFDGCWTWRRFLGCAGHDGEPACDFLLWVDGEWPLALQKALSKLWDLYGQEKEGRVNDALDNMEKRFKLKDEIEKMHIDLRSSQEEIKKIVEEKQVILALKAQDEQGLIDARAELEQKKAVDASTSNMKNA
ncbi:uncharacterized protein [Lolium perenne]|uniref:uncharacterized protein n=1 Tax=Lolium perenne TaxID=4522 RepID=UPI0021F53F81|nr:uncharacterized protein LOC127329004 [Lolium perenne]